MRALALALGLFGLSALAYGPPPSRPRPALRVYPSQTNGVPIVDTGECATVPLAGSYGESVAFTRPTPATCTRTDGGVVWLDGGQPATSGGAVKIRASATNYARMSEQLDQSPWVSSTTGANADAGDIPAPVLTANAATAPNDTSTAEQIDFPAMTVAACGSAYSIRGVVTTSAPNGTYREGVYARTVSGTGTLYISDGWGVNASYACAVTTAWTLCVNPLVTGSNTDKYIQLGPKASCSAAQPLDQPALSVYVWGAGIYNLGYMPDYCPTPASANATCNAETASGPALVLGATPSFASTINVAATISGCAMAVGYQASLCLDAGYPLCSVLLTDGGWQNLHSDAGAVALNTDTRLSCNDDGTNLTICRDRVCNSVAADGAANGASGTTWLGSDADAGGQLVGRVKDWCGDSRAWVCQ